MLGNVGSNTMAARAVTVTKSLSLKSATRFEFSFANDFVFPNQDIVGVQYSIQIDADAVAHRLLRALPLRDRHGARAAVPQLHHGGPQGLGRDAAHARQHRRQVQEPAGAAAGRAHLHP